MPDLNKLIETLETMAKSKVRIGVPEKENARKEGEKIGNAALAYIHQNGSVAAHIPPRPFMTNGVEAVRDRIVAIMEDGARHALETTNPNIVLQALHKVGAIAEESMKDAIDAGIPPPLSPITVARRMIRSPGSNYRRKATPAEQIAFNARFARGEVQMSESPTIPLHDTGNLLRAIKYVIDEDGKER